MGADVGGEGLADRYGNQVSALTARETECLLLLAKGLRNEEIGRRMGIKRITVDLHISSARKKLGAATREQAVARAVRLGIIDL